ncbi:hypothetical protein ACFL52_01765 [Candidatus Margulisiibacteriota bacterium]
MRATTKKGRRFWFLLAAVFFLFAFGGILLFTLPTGADIETVLAREGSLLMKNQLLLFSIFALTLSAVTAAKGYEVFTKEITGHINSRNELDNERTGLYLKITDLHKKIMDRHHQERILKKECAALAAELREAKAKAKRRKKNAKKV